MIAPAYYRSLLTPAEQEAYRTLVNGLLHRQTTIHLRRPRLSRENIRRVVNAIHMDHPELFFVDFWLYRFEYNALRPGVSVRFRTLLDEQPAAAVMDTLNARAADLKARLRRDMPPARAYGVVAKEITLSTVYRDTDDALRDHTAAGPVLAHSAVCEGIAKLFLFFCQRADLPCAVVTGTLKGMPHAWNMVELDGERKFVDLTGLLQAPPVYALYPDMLFRSGSWLLRHGYTIGSELEHVLQQVQERKDEHGCTRKLLCHGTELYQDRSAPHQSGPAL